MFFSISRQTKDNYSHQYLLGDFSVGTDAGWHETTVSDYNVLYKGYADSGSLQSLLPEIINSSEPQHTGNFCVLCLVGEQLLIKTDKWRSFPIYIADGQEITNLTAYTTTAWTDSLITINPDFSYTEDKFDAIGGFDFTPLTHQEGVQSIHDILTTKTKSFLENNTLPVKAFMSGGVDSALTYSYLSKHTSDYTNVVGNYLEWDEFWMKNSGILQKNWAYKQIHHWTDDCVLTTGSPGDEFMLRSPATANMYLMTQGTSIPQLNTSEENLHYSYYGQAKHLTIFEKQERDRKKIAVLSEYDRNYAICNNILNDWQHWHLGKTLTWTPLRDLRIMKILLRMPLASTTTQIMNSGISKELMDRNYPGISSAISDQKNTGNALKNLYKFYANI
jgi:hypothetical protein